MRLLPPPSATHPTAHLIAEVLNGVEIGIAIWLLGMVFAFLVGSAFRPREPKQHGKHSNRRQ